MFLVRAISRLRAAHALSFAMASGQQPDRADLASAGLDGVCTDFFGPRGDGDERRHRQPVVTSDAPLEPTLWNRGPATEAA